MDNNYFPHDFNARNDEDILKMFKQEGLEGIGIFWLLIEMLYEAGGWLKLDYEDLCFNLRVQNNKITLLKRVLNNYKLFEKKENRFTNSRVIETLEFIKNKSKKAQQSAAKRWGGNANAMRTQCDGNAINETKRNESKVKKEYTSKDLYLALTLKHLVRQNNPKAKWSCQQVRDWAEDINKMTRIDKRDYKDIEAVLRWSQQDKFWHKNILSGNKLRIQFDKLFLNMKPAIENTPKLTVQPICAKCKLHKVIVADNLCGECWDEVNKNEKIW